MPTDLLGLVRVISALPAAENTVSPAMAARIASEMRGIGEVAMLRALEEVRMQALNGIALEIMATADALSVAGTRYDPRHMRLMMREFDSQSSLICQTAKNALTSTPETLAGVYTEGRVNWDEVDRILRESKVVSGAAVLIVMIAVIAVLFLIDGLVRWIWALVYNRRACRVPATLEVGDMAIPGLVLTLGRGGFRFHPEDMSALTVAEGTPVVLDVQNAPRIAAILSRKHEVMADFRNDNALSIKVQNLILAMSTVSPYYIRKSRGGGEAQVAALVHPTPKQEATGAPPAGAMAIPPPP